MKLFAFSLALLFATVGCGKQRASKTSTPASSAATNSAPISGPFTSEELPKFAALDPIDTHTHVYQSDPEFYATLKKLNLHILDITLKGGTLPEFRNLAKEKADAWKVVDGSDGRVAFCSTFDPYQFSQPNFSRDAIRDINQDFARGAVAVKIWKNVGMEIKDANGHYILPDNPVFEPIFQDIQRHNKTLIAHLADPNYVWEAPTKEAPDYEYLQKHPELYVYGRPGVPTKEQILQARDRILDRNPNLRVVGAHLGSMESDFNDLSQHLDKYPNLVVDLAQRFPYFERQPRAQMIAFITKYQDRLIYGTDNEYDRYAGVTLADWQSTYANEWRYLATDDTILYREKRVEGLNLPQSILRKIYHDNAVKWFPGILGESH